jgi:hypothetical protein
VVADKSGHQINDMRNEREKKQGVYGYEVNKLMDKKERLTKEQSSKEVNKV